MTTECESWAAFVYSLGWPVLAWLLVNFFLTIVWYRPWNKVRVNISRLIKISDSLVSTYMLESVFQLNTRDARETWLYVAEMNIRKDGDGLTTTLNKRHRLNLQGTAKEKYEQLKVVYQMPSNSKGPAPRSPVVFIPELTTDIFVDTRSWWSRNFSRSSS